MAPGTNNNDFHNGKICNKSPDSGVFNDVLQPDAGTNTINSGTCSNKERDLVALKGKVIIL